MNKHHYYFFFYFGLFFFINIYQVYAQKRHPIEGIVINLWYKVDLKDPLNEPLYKRELNFPLFLREGGCAEIALPYHDRFVAIKRYMENDFCQVANDTTALKYSKLLIKKTLVYEEKTKKFWKKDATGTNDFFPFFDFELNIYSISLLDSNENHIGTFESGVVYQNLFLNDLFAYYSLDKLEMVASKEDKSYQDTLATYEQFWKKNKVINYTDALENDLFSAKLVEYQILKGLDIAYHTLFDETSTPLIKVQNKIDVNNLKKQFKNYPEMAKYIKYMITYNKKDFDRTYKKVMKMKQLQKKSG